MMDEVVKAAVDAAIGALTKSAVEPALTAGFKVWGWLKHKLNGDNAKTAEIIEADPSKASARTKATALLQDVLEGNAESAEELKQLLKAEGGVEAITQSANVHGDFNKLVQATGSNTISIS
jgi:hypothetical protein